MPIPAEDVAASHLAPRALPSPRLLSAAVAAGGALGALGRFGLSGWVTSWAGPLPWGTLAANAVGSLLLGCFAGAAVERLRPELRGGLTVGLCGGMTTFSTFDYEVHSLIASGAWTAALAYTGASVALCLVGVVAGLRLAGGHRTPG